MGKTGSHFLSLKQGVFLLSFVSAGRVVKKQACQQLQKAAVSLLDQHQNLSSLLTELGVRAICTFSTVCLEHFLC